MCQPIKIAVLASCILAGFAARAQVTEATVIDSAQVVVFNNEQKLQAFTQAFTKVNPNQSYAQLLQKQTGIFIRSTGASGLSTPSYKGLGTYNIPIFIDGQNIQSSMNGTMDLNLLDAALFSSASFKEPPNYFAGSANIGTGINLKTEGASPAIEVNVSGSSQNEKNMAIGYGNVSDKWKYRVAASGVKSANNVNLERYGKEGFQQNNDFWRASVLQTIETSNLNLEKGYWKNTIYAQSAYRQLPQGLFSGGSASQQDVNVMMSNKYVKWIQDAKWFLFAQNQLWFEEIAFTDNRSKQFAGTVLNSNSIVYLERELKKKWTAKAGMGNEWANYKGDNLEENVNWNRYRLFYSINKKWNHMNMHFKQQATLFQNQVFWNAKLNLDRVFNRKWIATLALQKNYRLPTLNELYWYEPGFAMGNINLKPEEGYRAEMSIKKVKEHWSIQVNPFYGYYLNFVAWQGFPEISPKNISSVQTMGLEINTVYKHSFNRGDMAVNYNFHWVHATNGNRNSASYGQQLIFTPAITSNATVTYQKRNVGVYLNEQFVGRNYFTSDNTAWLNPYLLTELGSYIQLNTWRVGATLSNAFNAGYYTVPNMPLPGRVLKLNINYNLPIKSWFDK